VGGLEQKGEKGGGEGGVKRNMGEGGRVSLRDQTMEKDNQNYQGHKIPFARRGKSLTNQQKQKRRKKFSLTRRVKP